MVHDRDRISANPHGAKAYRITITPDGEATTLLFENLQLPEARGQFDGGRCPPLGRRRDRLRRPQTPAEWSENKPAPPQPSAKRPTRRAIPRRTSGSALSGPPML